MAGSQSKKKAGNQAAAAAAGGGGLPRASVFLGCAVLLASVIGGARFGFADRYTPAPLESSSRSLSAFAGDYAQCRDAFVSAARAAGAQLHSIPIGENAVHGGKAPDGSPLTIDVAIIRGTPADRKAGRKPKGAVKRAVLHTTGVHGVELFAGSAVQVHFLRTDALSMSLADGDAVVLVHAVNPFGAAWLRRWNENGVDLNRNCMDDETRSKLGVSEAYMALDSLINPRRRLSWFTAGPAFYAQAGLVIARYGMRFLKDALVAGQWKVPDGLWYGGSRIEDGPVRLLALLARDDVLGLRRDGTGGSNRKTTPPSELRRLVHVDVHTGLGPYGLDTIISASPLSAMHASFPGASYASTNAEDGDVGIVYETPGDFGDHGVLRSAPAAAEKISVTQEFGTVEPVLVAASLRAENALVSETPAAPVTEWEKLGVLRAFYPDSDVWRGRVLERGSILLQQAVYAAFAMEGPF